MMYVPVAEVNVVAGLDAENCLGPISNGVRRNDVYREGGLVQAPDHRPRSLPEAPARLIGYAFQG
jgi:hypothetical protein